MDSGLIGLLLGSTIGPLIVGWFLLKIGDINAKKRAQEDAIKDLMTYRGDYSHEDFRKSLNKITVIFHTDREVLDDVRGLYVTTNTTSDTKMVERAIVGLIFKLCQKYGMQGLTEYDIDQTFLERIQTPTPSARSIQEAESITKNSKITERNLDKNESNSKKRGQKKRT